MNIMDVVVPTTLNYKNDRYILPSQAEAKREVPRSLSKATNYFVFFSSVISSPMSGRTLKIAS